MVRVVVTTLDKPKVVDSLARPDSEQAVPFEVAVNAKLTREVPRQHPRPLGRGALAGVGWRLVAAALVLIIPLGIYSGALSEELGTGHD